MKIEELELWAQKKGLKPKHLILSRGSSVKWLVCLRDVDEELRQLVVYDAEGKAYASIESRAFDEEFFEKINIIRDDDYELIVNIIKIHRWRDFDYIKAVG